LPLYFGEIHIHTALSDGQGSPSDNLRHARDVAQLDFAALADHALALEERDWETTKEALEDYYRPGRFATLLGFEWTHPSGGEVWGPIVREGKDPAEVGGERFGHRNVYYRGMEGKYYPWDQPKSDRPEKLWERLKEQKLPALLIPHHPASYVFPVDWEVHNPELERVVEIYSIWGSSEIPESKGNTRPIVRGGGETDEESGSHVQAALDRGHRLGIIAGSDGHDGHGGKTRHHRHNLTGHDGPFYPSGLTCVYAEELTREAIWDGLWDRRCYGTTGAKIKLDFQAEGQEMGSGVELPPGGELQVKGEVQGTADVQKMELMGSRGSVAETYGRSPEETLQRSVKMAEPGYLYLRVRQTDGEIAWSSPIWVE